ncbi:MAG: PA14 domain-containing protein, partial [Victivallaceae bacterium]
MMPPADNEEFQYHNWCIKYFGEVVNKNDDFDQDGLTNYQEFVLNSNPKLAPVNEPVLDNERIKSGFHSNYFAGAFEEMPDFTTIEAYKSGIIKTLNSTDINILDSEREQGFAASFDGFIKMQNSGSYRFYMAADDHAVLYLDGVKVGTAKSSNSVVDNTSYFDLSLLQGVHAIRVEYLQRAGNGMLKLEWAGPDFQRRFITEGDVWHFVVPNENYDEVINWQKDSDFDGVRDVIEI